jgi:hypothetical protein
MKAAALLVVLVACAPTNANVGDGGYVPTCKETIAQACANGDVRSGACGSPSQFVVDWTSTGLSCSRSTCTNDYTVLSYGGPTDTDDYELVYRGDSLVQVIVIPYLGNTYCLASDGSAVSIDSTTCTPAGMCNEPCTLAQGPCYSGECGPTTMTMCDGTTQQFSGCSCDGASWYCDGKKVDSCPLDAGTD